MSAVAAPLLEVRGLSVAFPGRTGPAPAVEDVDLSIRPGEVLGVVGESGSGKSAGALAVVGLSSANATVAAERLAFDGRDLRGLSSRERRAMAGRDVAMVFQEPVSSLNPCFTIGFQLKESLRRHLDLRGAELNARAAALLTQVGIPDPARRLSAFPHQLSGGMCQRVMIAMAIGCNPRLLIADEPTTALDVTIQRQILDLLRKLQRERGMALLLISHDVALVGEIADRVTVMYAGQVMETGFVAAVLRAPRHPYTRALLDAAPATAGSAGCGDEAGRPRRRLPAIPGQVPGVADRPTGCLFHPRCAFAQPRCRAERPATTSVGDGEDHAVRCHFPLVGSGGR